MIPSTLEAETFGLGEFIDRIAQRAGVTTEQAEVGARAVMTTLREAISEGEFKDMMAQLPEDFEQFVESAPSQARTVCWSLSITGETSAPVPVRSPGAAGGESPKLSVTP